MYFLEREVVFCLLVAQAAGMILSHFLCLFVSIAKVVDKVAVCSIKVR